MDIRCRKTTCMYNKTGACHAEKINIAKSIKCTTYFVDSEKSIIEQNKSTDMSREIFKGKTTFAPNKLRKHLIIECSANCLFNKDGKCKANGITVNDIRDPYCVTFLKK